MLIESCDGTMLKAKPLSFKPDVLVVVNEDDNKTADACNKLGFTPYTTELIYSGILN